MYYDVLIYKRFSHPTNAFFFGSSFKTYLNLKENLRSKIRSDLFIVYIRKVQKNLRCSWRLLPNISTEYYRLPVLYKDLQKVLDNDFNSYVLHEVSYATK